MWQNICLPKTFERKLTKSLKMTSVTYTRYSIFLILLIEFVCERWKLVLLKSHIIRIRNEWYRRLAALYLYRLYCWTRVFFMESFKKIDLLAQYSLGLKCSAVSTKEFRWWDFRLIPGISRHPLMCMFIA